MNFYKLMEFLFSPKMKESDEEKLLRAKFFEQESNSVRFISGKDRAPVVSQSIF